MIDARHRHAAIAHRVVQHAEAAQVGDVEHQDEVGAADLLHRLRGPVDAGQVVQQELESRRRGRRVGDHRVGAERTQQVHHRHFAAESVAVGIDVGGDADPLARFDRRGERSCRGSLLGGK